MAHAGGRPTDYDDTTLDKAKEYLQSRVDQEYEFHKTRGTTSDSYEQVVRVNLPGIEGLALHLDVSRQTIYEWEKIYPEFSDTLEKIRVLQGKRLIDGSLSGRYNPMISKVLLTKHGYREGIEQTGADGKDLIPEAIDSEQKKQLLSLLNGNDQGSVT